MMQPIKKDASKLETIQQSKVYIQLTMDDFQALRKAAETAIRPRVPYNAADLNQMANTAAMITNGELSKIVNILEKYEYMEHEGFAGPKDEVELPKWTWCALMRL